MPIREICSEGVIPLDYLSDFWWVSCRMARLHDGAIISPEKLTPLSSVHARHRRQTDLPCQPLLAKRKVVAFDYKLLWERNFHFFYHSPHLLLPSVFPLPSLPFFLFPLPHFTAFSSPFLPRPPPSPGTSKMKDGPGYNSDGDLTGMCLLSDSVTRWRH